MDNKINKLYSFNWCIESKCINNCIYCNNNKKDSLSLENNKKVFDNISQLDIDSINISGGEPLLYRDLFLLIDYIKSINSNIKLLLSTNGMELSLNDYVNISNYFDSLCLSIDSININTNKLIGRNVDSVYNYIYFLSFYNDLLDIKIRTMINQYNINELDKLYRLINEYNISKWNIYSQLNINDFIISLNDDRISFNEKDDSIRINSDGTIDNCNLLVDDIKRFLRRR